MNEPNLPKDHLAWSPNILDILEDEIHKQGFAGSANIPKLVYLAHMSSVLPRPVSLVIKGPSGSGKSFSLNMGEQFIPKSAYERVEGMSEKALLYMPDIDLRQKHLVIGEAAGLAEGQGRVFLRQLLSEGHVRYLTVDKGKSGEMTGKEMKMLAGPTGLIMTTTAGSLHPEDESRMISVSIKDSADQIADALMAHALGIGRPAYQPNLAPWHELYELVKSQSKGVSIPFAAAVARALPRTHDRIKRDFTQFLSLTETCVLVHRLNRPEKDGQVVANADDYSIVRALLNDALAHNLSIAVPPPVRAVVEAVRTLQKPVRLPGDREGVTHYEIAEHMHRDRSVVSRSVARAIDEGFLEDATPGRGVTSHVLIGTRDMPSGEVLPAYEELEVA